MTVQEMIEAIEKGELKIKDLASQFGFSDRTIQTKIKNLGYKWNPRVTRYGFWGEDEKVKDMPIEELFKKQERAVNSSKKAVKKTSVKPSPKAVKKADTSKVKVSTEPTESMDSIDKLLAGKKPKREYKGYYFDRDIIEVLDSLKNVNKSDLINECLRKVFKDKGLL